MSASKKVYRKQKKEKPFRSLKISLSDKKVSRYFTELCMKLLQVSKGQYVLKSE